MLKNLTRTLQAGLTIGMANRVRLLAIQRLQIEVAKGALRAVQLARTSTIGLVWVGALLGLLGFGFLLVHAAVFILLPWGLTTKALIGLFLGCGYVCAGLVALRAALSEKTWMGRSGVTQLVDAATCLHPVVDRALRH